MATTHARRDPQRAQPASLRVFAEIPEMPESSGEMQAGEDETLAPEIIEIPLLPEGTFEHPWYGELDWAPSRLQQMAENFQSGVLGVAPCLNFDHCAMGKTKAAGWIEDVFYVPGVGLEARVKLNKSGREAVGEREYRYISAEVAEDYCRADGRSYRNVIVGAALTNTPFHDSMRGLFSKNGESATIYRFSASDSRAYWVAGEPARKGKPMILEFARRLLGLNPGAPEDEVAVHLAQRLPATGSAGHQPEPTPVELSQLPRGGTAVQQPTENPESIRLARENEALAAQVKELNSRLERERAEAHLAIVQEHVAKFTAAGIIPPAVKDQAVQLAAFNLEAFTAVFGALTPVAAVAPLSADPTRGSGTASTSDLHALAVQIQQRDNVNYITAMSTLMAENPEAAAQFERHRNSLARKA